MKLPARLFAPESVLTQCYFAPEATPPSDSWNDIARPGRDSRRVRAMDSEDTEGCDCNVIRAFIQTLRISARSSGEQDDIELSQSLFVGNNLDFDDLLTFKCELECRPWRAFGSPSSSGDPVNRGTAHV